jgi:mannose-1-phosphate guanylyltransferase
MGDSALNDTFGILLVGAHPWSASAFDSLLPRTLLPVAHRPLISYGLSWLHDQGIHEVAVCGNRETRLVQQRLDRHVPAGMSVSYHEDPVPRGTAGSARDASLATLAQTFVIADGTVVPDLDLSDLLEKHHASGAAITVVVHSEARRKGQAPLHAPGGIYVFSRRVLHNIPSHGFCDIKETLIPQLHTAGERIIAYDGGAASPRIIDSSSYMAVNEWMVERLVNNAKEQGGYFRLGSALVHREAMIAGDASIVGPVLIGPGARVLSGAVVVGPSSIGREATIGRGAMISRSAVWRRALVGDHAVADRCLVADDGVIRSRGIAVRGIVTGEGSSAADVDYGVERPSALRRVPAHLQRGPSLGVSTRLGRFVFGASWTRSPAAE